MVKLFIMGKDKRQELLKNMYSEENILVENISNATHVVLPIPISKDGVNINGEDIEIEDIVKELIHKTVITGGVSVALKRKLEMHNVKVVDILARDDLAIKNAIPTAEGAVKIVLELRDEVLFKTNVLVLGFGRVGKILADRLKGLGANVFCEARKEKDLALIYAMGYNDISLEKLENTLPHMDVIFNTIPYMVLNKRMLSHVKKDAIIIDLASAPGGTDFEEAKVLGIKAVLELGIPAKCAAKSAAKYVKEVVDQVIKGG